MLLDPRGGSLGEASILRLRSSIPAKHRVELCTLDSADVRFHGNGPDGRVSIGIEIKHLSDFLQSMADGRLAGRQLREMRREYDYCFLLIQDRIAMSAHGHLQVWLPAKPKDMSPKTWGEKRYEAYYYNRGRYVDTIFGARSKFLWSAFWSHVISLSARGGFRLLMAGSNQEVGAQLGGAYDWWQKKWFEHSSVNVFDESHLPELVEASAPARMLHAGVLNLGWALAMKVAEHFGSIDAAAQATFVEWLEIDGIGPVLAKRAMRALRTKHVFRSISGRPGEVRRKEAR